MPSVFELNELRHYIVYVSYVRASLPTAGYSCISITCLIWRNIPETTVAETTTSWAIIRYCSPRERFPFVTPLHCDTNYNPMQPGADPHPYTTAHGRGPGLAGILNRINHTPRMFPRLAPIPQKHVSETAWELGGQG